MHFRKKKYPPKKVFFCITHYSVLPCKTDDSGKSIKSFRIHKSAVIFLLPTIQFCPAKLTTAVNQLNLSEVISPLSFLLHTIQICSRKTDDSGKLVKSFRIHYSAVGYSSDVVEVTYPAEFLNASIFTIFEHQYSASVFVV